MYSYIYKASALGLNILAALVTVAPHPANAQYFSHPVDINQSRQFFNEGSEVIKPVNAQNSLNFTDFNQPSQFFNEGHEQIEREIKVLQQDLEIPQIEIPQHSYRDRAIQNLDIYAEAKLQPITEETAIDDRD